jgi:hypothetical protein
MAASGRVRMAASGRVRMAASGRVRRPPGPQAGASGRRIRPPCRVGSQAAGPGSYAGASCPSSGRRIRPPRPHQAQCRVGSQAAGPGRVSGRQARPPHPAARAHPAAMSGRHVRPPGPAGSLGARPGSPCRAPRPDSQAGLPGPKQLNTSGGGAIRLADTADSRVRPRGRHESPKVVGAGWTRARTTVRDRSAGKVQSAASAPRSRAAVQTEISTTASCIAWNRRWRPPWGQGPRPQPLARGLQRDDFEFSSYSSS